MKVPRRRSAVDILESASRQPVRSPIVTRLRSMPGDRLMDETVPGKKLEVESVEADRLNVTNLSAISADLGTVTVGNLEGVTITGGLFRTSESGARWEMDDTSIRGLDDTETEKFLFDLSSGILNLTAVVSTQTGSQIDTEHLAGQITEVQIEDDAIKAPKIAANQVTTDHLFVTNLAAITSDLGEVTAGTLTSPLIRTSASGTRLQLDDAATRFRLIHTDFDADPVRIQDTGVRLFADQGEIDTIGGGTGSSANPISLKWLGFSDPDNTGTLVTHFSIVSTAGDSSFNETKLISNPARAAGYGELTLAAYDDGTSSSGFNIRSPIGGIGRIRAFSGGHGRDVLNEDGESDFLQLASTADRKVNFGSVTVPQTGSAHSEVTVSHGLGATPVSIIVTSMNSRHMATAPISRVTSSSFDVFVRENDSSDVTSDIDVSWMAVV